MKRQDITKEQIEKFYIEENHSIDECCEKFNISRTTFKNRLKSFGIKKSVELSTQCSKEKLESKYGIGYNPLGDREKIKVSLLEKYGVDNPMKSEEIQKKVRSTNLERYGVEVPIQNEDIFKKIMTTNLLKYGSSSSLGSPEVRQKAKDSCYEKYGVAYPLESDKHRPILLNKRRRTNMERYGAEEVTMSDHFKNKVKERCHERYGTSSPNESIYSSTIFKDIDSFKIYISKFGTEKPTVIDIKNDLSLSETYILNKVHKLDADDLIQLKPKRSSYEKEIFEFFINNGILEEDIILNSKNIIKDDKDGILEVDIFIKSKNIAIEFNGTYWHSSIYKEPKYHQNKSLLSEKAGIRLIHIYEYEWVDPLKKEIIKSILLNAVQKTNKKIYAKNCSIGIPDKEELREFLNRNHLQGYRGSSKEYGLYFNNSLVQVMTFSKNKEYDWEIIREVSQLNLNIVGGSSKLFKHFLKTENIKSVFSYCDFNKFTGKGYEKIGMEFIGYTTPDMKWIVGNKVINRNPSKNLILKESADAQIFGAGSKKYLFKLET